MGFVHLHVHSEYSFLDGLCRLKDLVVRSAEMGMPAVALTDYNGLYGAIEFYQLAREAGIKPILGCEISLADDSRLILLAKNRSGYENLVQLVSRAHLEGNSRKPLFTRDLLEKHSPSLVALSGSLTGEISQLLLAGKYPEAKVKALEYREIMGPEGFYLEVQNHGLSEERQVSSLMKMLSRETLIPLVASNDVHYLDAAEASLHRIMRAIRTRQPIKNFKSLVDGSEYFLKSPAEMISLFDDMPEAIENTLKIAHICSLDLETDIFASPDFSTVEGLDANDLFIHLCQEGLKKRYVIVSPEIQQRLQGEIKVILQMNLAPYFLLVADLVSFARKKEIPLGPGRGSAGGSMAAYCLGITDIDPIKHGLFFERFLNPERCDLPDIDLDLCYRRRGELLDYLYQKYAGRTAQIGIFSTFGARAAVRDVGKALDLPQRFIELLAGNLPHFSGRGGLEHSLATLPEFKTIPVDEEPFRTLIEQSKAVEGRIRHSSIHAAGVLVGDENLARLVPLQLGPEGQIVSQYGPESLKALGLMKIDLLGLRNLTIIDDTLKLVSKKRGMDLRVDQIALDDEATYDLLQKGQTLGCFQMESLGMRSLLKKLKPQNIDDLIILLALYRPGPWNTGMVETLLKRRKGEEAVSYPHPCLEPVLKDTYGLLLFQEQIMQIAHLAAGYSMGAADLLRRAIAGKGKDLVQHEHSFVKGCRQNGLSGAEARNIFASLSSFGGYSFNKAHSTAYAYISYQTAFLKANYPLEYLVSLLNSQTGYYSMSVYVEEARRNGIRILPPDINESDSGFTVEDGIRVGLGMIKGLGVRSMLEILSARTQGGAFHSLYDFCCRVDTKIVKKTAIQNLIKAGAFDSLGLNRPQLLESLDGVMKAAQYNRRNRESGQICLWDYSGMPDDYLKENIPDYSQQEKMKLERELLSINIHEHPLSGLTHFLQKHRIKSTREIRKQVQGTKVKIAGTVVNFRRQPTKNNEYLIKILLEDQWGQVEVLVLPSTYERYLYELNPEGILVRGKLVFEGEEPRVIAESIQALDEFIEALKG